MIKTIVEIWEAAAGSSLVPQLGCTQVGSIWI